MSIKLVGFVVGRALLAMLFFGVVTPVSLCLRMVGFRPLTLRFDPAATTYWLPVTRDGRGPFG